MDKVLFDVLAVDAETHNVCLVGVNKTIGNAVSLIKFLVRRHGVFDDFFVTAPAGKYNDGDVWEKEKC